MLRRLGPALALIAALPASPRADELHVNLPVDLSVTAAAAVGAAALRLGERDLLPADCRWCAPGRFDAWAHRQLVWSHPATAAHISDVLGVAVPAGAAAALLVPTLAQGKARRAAEDALVVAEAFSIVLLGTEATKVGTARLRPDAYDGTGPRTALDSRVSFWSGHTSSAFAAATAAGTVAMIRDYDAWPWIMGVGLAGAATTGYLRVAADRHWATDVVAGAAFGSAVGVVVPLLHRDRDARVRLLPAPGGLAVIF